MQVPSTVDLVNFLLGDLAKPKENVLQAARVLTLDVLGVAAAGSSTNEGRSILTTVERMGRTGSCNVPGSTRTYDPATSAMLTGTMAYSIGLTDTHSASITHPGPSVVPVALAVGQAQDSDADEILTAIVLGVEAVVRIGAIVNPSHRSRGFHPTGTCNVFGSAVAATYLLGGDHSEIVSALGLAGSMASGLYEFRNEGSMVMALHAGWPAAGGTTAAYLATSGFTGPSTIIEGPEGFVRAYSDVRHAYRIVPRDGVERAGIEDLSMRPYCACRYAHAAIDAILRIRATQRNIAPEEIDRLTVWTHKTAVDQESDPTTLVSARLSTRFTVALTALRGPQLAEVSAGDLDDPQISGLYERVEIREDPELTELFPRVWACRVEIRTNDGGTYSEYVEAPKGDPSNPMTPEELQDKFIRLAGPAVGSAAADEVRAVVMGHHRSTPMSSVLGLMGGS